MFQGFHLVIGDRLNATRRETALWKMDKIDIGSGREDLLYTTTTDWSPIAR